LSENYTKDLRKLLEVYNPWWNDSKWYERDQLILEYQQGAFRIISRLYYHIKRRIVIPGKYGIVTIRGPRRSGKTTMIKLVIKDLIEEYGIDPSNIFYISLDYSGLKDIKLFEILRNIADVRGNEKYVFLDEVSMYEDWALELKNTFDANIVSRGKLKIVATGSHSMDLAEAVEKLRGRQGDLAREFNVSGNLLYTPLRFPEVVESINKEVMSLFNKTKFRRVSNRFNILKNLSEGIVNDELKELYDSYFDIFSQLFENYFMHGGYPKAVKEFYELKSISKELYADLTELLISDSKKAGLDANTLKILLTDHLTKPEKLSGILNLSNIELKNVKKSELQKYLRYLISTWAFFLSYSERRDEKCEPNYKDNEHLKLYVLDPFIFHALHSYINNTSNPFEESKKLVEKPEFQGLLVESIIASHMVLSQQLFEHVPQVNYDKILMYTTGGNEDHEIDFVLCINKNNEIQRFLIESKYRWQIHKTALPPKTIVLTKKMLEVDKENKIVYIPTSIFLMLF